VIVMAGPGVVESREQMETIAGRLAKRGVRVLRSGAFRTSDDPYGFQGLGEEGLKLLREVADRHRMLTHSTIFDATQLPLFARYVDIVQVSERDMRNYALLKELAKLGKPVMLRRGASSTIEETLMAADYVMRCGNHQVIVCERGIRTFETYTRHTLDLSAIPVIKKLSSLPIIVDPSRAMGRRDKVPPMARAAVAAGADGLLIEVHQDPDHALSDGAQSLTLEQFDKLIDQLRLIASAVERAL
jgi:3-deoxy-7-phosphoheptulonate synthase